MLFFISDDKLSYILVLFVNIRIVPIDTPTRVLITEYMITRAGQQHMGADFSAILRQSNKGRIT
jgi:hypothetical protein